jgi:hypothetical protein
MVSMMTNFSAGAVSSFLSVLRTLPVWLIAGLALTFFAVLFAPAFGGVDLTRFRSEWGVWLWIGGLTFSILAVTRSIDSGIANYALRQRRAEARRALRLVPRATQCWWYLAKQRDDSFISQITFDVEAANLTDHPVRIVKGRLIRPRTRGEVVHASVMLPKRGSPYHSESHAIPPRDTATASVHLMMRGALARQGEKLRATIEITDQYGDEYRLKRVVFGSKNLPLPQASLIERVKVYLTRAFPSRSFSDTKPEDLLPPPPEWKHEGRFEAVDLILNEERRNYTANGRERGGLGSLDVTLQSEPNFGWTEVGKVPNLLWSKDEARTIGSDNLARLIGTHASLAPAEKIGLEQYLLSHLDRRSPYADIAYFIFLGLHRMGKSAAALEASRLRLSGDKEFGYSNVLGVLSALVSHEHFAIDTKLYARILGILDGDTEANFRLPEKINLARLQQLNSSDSGSK